MKRWTSIIIGESHYPCDNQESLRVIVSRQCFTSLSGENIGPLEPSGLDDTPMSRGTS